MEEGGRWRREGGGGGREVEGTGSWRGEEGGGWREVEGAGRWRGEGGGGERKVEEGGGREVEGRGRWRRGEGGGGERKVEEGGRWRVKGGWRGEEVYCKLKFQHRCMKLCDSLLCSVRDGDHHWPVHCVCDDWDVRTPLRPGSWSLPRHHPTGSSGGVRVVL